MLPLEAARELTSLGGLPPGATVLDVGAGTGRVSISFAALGYKTVALDPALPMLKELYRKAPIGQIQTVVGEGARLPFPNQTFDAVILARVLYLMSDWQPVLQQAYDVLTPGGCLFHEWSNGEDEEAWVQIREKSRSLFEEAGVQNPFHPGARSEADVDEFLAGLALKRTNRLRTGPGPTMTLAEFLGKVVSGEFSYIWSVPKPIQESCLPRLKDWAENTFDLDEAVSIPNQLHWTIYRKSEPLRS